MSKNILYLKFDSILSYFHIFMKACHERKAETLHLGARKIILAAYALILNHCH